MGQRVPCLVFGVLAEEIEGVPGGDDFVDWFFAQLPANAGIGDLISSDYECDHPWVGGAFHLGLHETVDFAEIDREAVPGLRQGWDAVRRVAAKLGVTVPEGRLLLTSREVA